MSFTYNSNIGYRKSGVTYGGYGQFGLRTLGSTTFVDRIQKPNIKKVFLATITLTQWLKAGAKVVSTGEPLYDTLKYAVKIPWSKNALPVNVFRDGAGAGLVQGPTHTDNYGTTPIEHVAVDYELNPTLGKWGYREKDPADGKPYIYVNPPGGNFYDHVWHAELQLYLASEPKTFRSLFWDPRIKSVPSLSMRIESQWGGVGQIGSGTMHLINGDNHFGGLDTEDIQWDAGVARLEMGIDLPITGGEMAESDYLQIGSWRIERTEKNDEVFTVTMRELKTRLENKIPYEVFTREAFPSLPPDAVGKPIPYAWGRIYGAKPVLIDASAKKFKVASHPIRSFDGVRVRIEDVWREVNFATFDHTKAEFTLGAEWTGSEDVAVDFSGRKNPNGSLMQNGANVIADLLDLVGETSFDAQSFDHARQLLELGKDRYGDEVCALAPAIFLDTERTAIDVAGELNEILGSHLFIDFQGKWRFGIWDAVQGETLEPFPGNVSRSFTEKDVIEGSFGKTVDASKVFSRLKVNYAHRRQEKWSEFVEGERPRNEHVHGLPKLFTKVRDLGLSTREDANYWIQRALVTDAEQLTLYTFAVPWNGFFMLPGEHIRLAYAPASLDAVLEVITVNYDLNGGTVRITAGNQRAWGDTFGFWGEESQSEPVIPATKIWLRPEALSYTSGQGISIWPDSSGNNRHLTQTAPLRQPTFAVNLLNGHAGVRFSNTSSSNAQFLALPSNVFSGWTAGHIFAVMKADADPGAGSGIGNAHWSLGGGGAIPRYPDNFGIVQENFGSTGLKGTDPTPSLATFRIYEVAAKSLSFIQRLDNAVFTTDLTNVVAFSTIPVLGADGPAATYGFAGYFAEILIYDRELSSSERTTVIQYLSDKYALGILAAGAVPTGWNPAWTDAEVATARQNNGYFTGTQQESGQENDMADEADARSHFPGRWM